MLKEPRRKAILTIGIIVGLWNILPSIGDKSNNQFIIIGLVSFFLSFGFFMLWRWMIIPILLFCAFIFFVFISLFIAAVMRLYQGFAGIALLFYFPTLILCLLFADKLLRKEIRDQFK